MTNTVKIDTGRPDFTDNRAGDPRNSDTPSSEAKETFEKAMGEKREGGSSNGGDNNREDGDGGYAMPSPASLLGALFEGKINVTAAPPSAMGNLDDLVDSLVKSILVSDPKSGPSTEIRLQLNDSILPDSQIILSRGADGLLSVLLTTDNASSMQTLVAAQQSLHEQLEKYGPVDVKVSGTNENGQDDGDANRRSRGLIDYESEHL